MPTKIVASLFGAYPFEVFLAADSSTYGAESTVFGMILLDILASLAGAPPSNTSKAAGSITCDVESVRPGRKLSKLFVLSHWRATS